MCAHVRISILYNALCVYHSMGSSNARKQDVSRFEKCSKERKKESRKFTLRQNFALRSQGALIVSCFYGTMIAIENIYQRKSDHYAALYIELPRPVSKKGLHT